MEQNANRPWTSWHPRESACGGWESSLACLEEEKLCYLMRCVSSCRWGTNEKQLLFTSFSPILKKPRKDGEDSLMSCYLNLLPASDPQWGLFLLGFMIRFPIMSWHHPEWWISWPCTHISLEGGWTPKSSHHLCSLHPSSSPQTPTFLRNCTAHLWLT